MNGQKNFLKNQTTYAWRWIFKTLAGFFKLLSICRKVDRSSCMNGDYMNMKHILSKIIFPVVVACLSLAVVAQDTMVRRVQKSHGQTSPVIIWLFIAIVPVLFLIFAIAKSKRAKREVVNDANKEERVVKNTLPKRE